MVQETKYRRKGLFKAKSYEIFEQIRRGAGGSLLTGVHKNLNPVLVSDGSEDEIEILVVQGEVSGKNIRFINGYGPQEYAASDDRIKFFARLEEEIILSKLNGCLTCVEMDANAKLGPAWITGDPHSQSPNGELLHAIIVRNNLSVCNALKNCEGVITRRKVTINGVEESVIDFMLVCEELITYFSEMKIDESRLYSLTRYQKTKNGIKVTESDHNTLVSHFDIKWDVFDENKNQIKVFNFKDLEAQKVFTYLTSKNTLSNLFKNPNIKDPCKKWHSEFLNILHRSFKKVKITGSKKENNDILRIMKVKQETMEKIDNFRYKLDEDETVTEEEYRTYFDLLDILEKVNTEIADKTAQKNADMIYEHFANLCDTDGGFSLPKMWGLRQKICQKAGNVPTAMKDEKGNIISNRNSLITLYQKTYQDRLTPKPQRPEWKEVQSLKETLFKLMIRKSAASKSRNWTDEKVGNVCRKLKNRKARDESGFIFELFKTPLAGTDVQKSLTEMFNFIKSNLSAPFFMKMMSITSLYKNKGPKSDFNNQRGIFNVSKVKSIMDKLIYSEIYPTVDNELSNSNVGGRKGRSVRDHIFIIRSIIYDILNGSAEPVDFQLFNITKCFDEMGYHETHNDLLNRMKKVK